MVAFASVKWPMSHATKGGVELWWGFNDDQVCLDSAGSIPCRRTFPVFIGVAPTISTELGRAVEVGFGPGVFERYYSSNEKSVVGGAVGQITAPILRSRYANVLLSVRPFVGPRLSGRTAWVIPILLGLSR
jgi:hypothetical protein